MSVKKPKIVVIVGPTASGKSNLAVTLAKRFNGEIISADSRQIYRGMDIGTAKPSKDNAKFKNPRLRRPACCAYSAGEGFGGQEKSKLQVKIKNEYIAYGIRHHLIDIKNPNKDYSAAEFKKDALVTIRKILRRGKLPILVGGTGLYIRAVVENLAIPKVKADPKLRQELERELEQEGLPHLFRKLVEVDPEAVYVVDPKNPRRVIRALEVSLKTGEPFSAQRRKGKSLFQTLQIGVTRSHKELKKRIGQRVDKMIRDGLVDEVKNLIKKYGPNQRAFDTIGYREIIDYLDGKISLTEAVELIKKNTRAYAKRQMTWFKKDKSIMWIKKPQYAIGVVKKFLKKKPAA